jgi:hypothetical protein
MSIFKVLKSVVIVTLIYGSLGFSGCPDDPVAPGTILNCVVHVTTWEIKADGSSRFPTYTYRNVPAGSDGKCPPPTYTLLAPW